MLLQDQSDKAISLEAEIQQRLGVTFNGSWHSMDFDMGLWDSFGCDIQRVTWKQQGKDYKQLLKKKKWDKKAT